MDLHALRIDLLHQAATVRAADADGVVEHQLTGGPFARVQEAAQPLLDWAHAHLDKALRTPADATLGHIELDAISRRVRLGFLAEQSLPDQPRSSRTPPALRECEVDYDAVQDLLREAARTAVRSVFPRQPEPDGLPPESAGERWERKYQMRSDGWELGRVPPPLVRALEHITRQSTRQPGPLHDPAQPSPRQPLRAIVVGCGRGHEARLLARGGADVTAIDIAPSAVRYLTAAAEREGLGARLTALQADLFTLAEQDPRHRGAYDLLTEHCVFCAIEPERREDYVQAAAALLRPGGLLVGLFYCHSYPGGPPYAVPAAEVRSRLGAAFDILSDEVPRDSVITRAGQELLLVARRRPAA